MFFTVIIQCPQAFVGIKKCFLSPPIKYYDKSQRRCCQYKTYPELTVVATEHMSVYLLFGTRKWLFQKEKLKYSLMISIKGSLWN